MNRVIATTSPINTHSTTAWSIHEPSGGLPGRKLRSGTMANSIAAYHVTNGGKNVVLPNNIGMATHNAKTGKAIKYQADSQVEDQRRPWTCAT